MLDNEHLLKGSNAETNNGKLYMHKEFGSETGRLVCFMAD